MTSRELYRTESLNARQAHWLGEIILIRPIAFTFLSLLAFLSAIIVLSFMFFGTYTKRTTVTGHLVPHLGLVKVYAPQIGIVVKKNASEGQPVKQGDILYVVSSDRRSDTHGAVQETISSQVRARRDSLNNALEKTRQITEGERNTAVKRIADLKSELIKIDNQIEGQFSRVKLAEDAVVRTQYLEAQRFISKEQLQERQADLLDQRSRLQSLERDKISVNRDLTSYIDDLTSMPLRHQNTLAEIERNINILGQEFTESEAKRRLEITAPESGTATAVMGEIGQMVDGNKSLVSIVPSGAILQAYLYAPSRAIGFLSPGDKVFIRYQAYPYQKFGQAQGTIANAAKVALSRSELFGIGGSSDLGGDSEPLYRVTVSLDKQTIQVYGRPQQLQAGMTLEADILQEKRRLYEWVLEPLYSLSGKF